MKLKVLFLTVIIILAVAGAGSVWVWQKGEGTTPLPMVDNEPQNGTPNIHTDVEVIQPRINPETGWKIFEHPDVPITFEYPGEMKVVSIDFIEEEYRLPGASITLKSTEHQLDIEFALPTIDGGYAWGFAEFIEDREIIINGKKFQTSIRGDSYANSDATTFYDATPLPKPFVAVIACKEYGCSRDKTLSLFRQFVSSIKILSK